MAQQIQLTEFVIRLPWNKKRNGNRNIRLD